MGSPFFTFLNTDQKAPKKFGTVIKFGPGPWEVPKPENTWNMQILEFACFFFGLGTSWGAGFNPKTVLW